MKAVALDMSSLTCSIKTFFGRYIKNYFGKGPEKVTVLIGKDRIVVELHGLLYKTEKELIGFAGVEKAVKDYRNIILKTLNEEIEPIEKGLGFAVKGVFFDFLPEKDACYITIDLSCSKGDGA